MNKKTQTIASHHRWRRRVRKIPRIVSWWWARHVTYPWWSLQNFRKGYRWNAIQRCRRCDHTSPSHYTTCVHHVGNREMWAP